MRWMTIALCAWVGCGGSGGLSPVEDGGATWDAAGRTCTEIPDDVKNIVATHLACSSDAECTNVTTRCGLTGYCGVYVNEAANNGLATFSDEWDRQQCGAGLHCKACSGAIFAAGCVSGTCQAKPTCASLKVSVQAWLDGHDTCANDSDCVLAIASCGLPGQCGAYLRGDAAAALDEYNKAWTGLGCDVAMCVPCDAPTPAVCKAGKCTGK